MVRDRRPVERISHCISVCSCCCLSQSDRSGIWSRITFCCKLLMASVWNLLEHDIKGSISTSPLIFCSCCSIFKTSSEVLPWISGTACCTTVILEAISDISRFTSLISVDTVFSREVMTPVRSFWDFSKALNLQNQRFSPKHNA